MRIKKGGVKMESKKYIYIGGVTNEYETGLIIGAEYNIAQNEFGRPCTTNHGHITRVLNNTILKNCFKEVK